MFKHGNRVSCSQKQSNVAVVECLNIEMELEQLCTETTKCSGRGKSENGNRAGCAQKQIQRLWKV